MGDPQGHGFQYSNGVILDDFWVPPILANLHITNDDAFLGGFKQSAKRNSHRNGMISPNNQYF